MKFAGEIKTIGKTIVIEAPYGIKIEDGKYLVEISDYKKNRSLSQNALLWKIINEISRKENGNYAESQNIYLNLLKMAHAKYEYMLVKNEALNGLKSIYKDIQVIKEDKEKEQSIVRVYYGSSKMNTEEMSELIKVAIQYAEEVGIDTTSYYLEIGE